MDMNRKLKIGWFSFSCCEDSTIIFTELLNDYYHIWKEKIEFKSILVLQKKSDIRNLDIAFVEGAITSKKQENQLLQIRRESKFLVAIGACACVGMPSAVRNQFDEKTKAEIKNLIIRFQYAPTVKKLSEVVTVDDQVPGCPMDENIFISLINRYIQALGNTPQ